jgi:hypothetical protein
MLGAKSLPESSILECRRDPGNDGAVPAGDGGSDSFVPGNDGIANGKRELM